MLRLVQGFKLFDVGYMMKTLKHYLDKKRAESVNSLGHDEGIVNFQDHVTVVLIISFGLHCFEKCLLILNLSYVLGLSWFIILELVEDLYLRKNFKDFDPADPTKKSDFANQLSQNKDWFIPAYGLQDKTPY